jgi:hypothetical protein
MSDIDPEARCYCRPSRQRIVDGTGNAITNRVTDRGWLPGDQLSSDIACLPKRTKPGRTIVERVVQVDEEGRTRLERPNGGSQGSLRIVDVMQNAETVAEIHRVGLEAQLCGGSAMKYDVGVSRQVLPCDIDSIARVDAVERTNAWCNVHCPAAGPASQIKSRGVVR